MADEQRKAVNGHPILSLDNVWASYDGGMPILQGASLSIAPGRLVALLGGNGAGKSTTLKAIAGLLHLHSGSIRLQDEEITGLRPHQIVTRGVAFAVQGKDVFPSMTVEENLLLGAFSRKDAQAIRDDLDEMYEMFPVLRTRREQAAAYLSGGERQMLVLARGLMVRPSLLLVDEPSAALAPKIVEEVMQTLKKLKERGLTILLVEQNVSAALEIADEFLVLRGGVVVASGDIADRDSFEMIKKMYYGVVMGEATDDKLHLA